MAQRRFKDPIVSAGPTLTGAGNGTLTVDRLTHFTVAQTYTFTCIAKAPDTIFTVVASLDGPVGLATAGTQFFDQDLKIFATIQQGSTPFEVGDSFVVTVVNGTDLNQDNIDDYDEEPQKNFGAGTKGTMSGDHSVRLVTTAQAARLFLQDLKFLAVISGAPGNAVQIRYDVPVAGVQASLVLQDLTYTSDAALASANAITVEYLNFIAPVRASVTIQNVRYQAVTIGTPGNAVSVRYISGGSLSIGVVGNAITVTLAAASTALDVVTAINADISASALVTATVTPSGSDSTVQSAPVSTTSLTGGVDASGNAGAEVVTVTGSAIQVRLETGVSTATQVLSALTASAPAMALVSVALSGSGTNPQTAPVSSTNLAGGADPYGQVGSEQVHVTGSIIDIFMESGKSTAAQILTALNASSPALALVTPSISGNSARPQYRIGTNLFNLSGGLDKQFTLNHDEITAPGSFAEGNADLLGKDIQAQGDLDVAGHARHAGIVELDDQSASNDRSGPSIANAQRFLNDILENFRMTFRTADDTKVSWAKPLLSFEADIEIYFEDSGFVNTIAVANSPITIADGQSLYVIVDRSQTMARAPIVGTIPQIPEAIRIATRHGDNLILADNTLLRDGRSAGIGEGGSGGTLEVDLYNPISTTLPTGATATIDGVSLTNGMFVLFSNLSSGNNEVYKAGGVGTSITWTAQSVFSNGSTPALGDDVTVKQGVAFAQAHGFFDGTTFVFNDRVRYYNGADYWEVSNIKQAQLLDNTTGNVFAINYAGSENIFVDYSVIRSGQKRAGTIILTTDGTTVAFSDSGSEFVPDLGISFDSDISGAQIRLRYACSSTGANGTMKFVVRRWSDASGGPAGLPSYSGASGVAAAGSDTQIQFNDSGSLGADSDFTWSKTSNILSLGQLQAGALQSLTVPDAQVSPSVLLSYDATSFPCAIFEYSFFRDGDRKMGRLMITTNGTDVGFDDDTVETATIGVDIVDVQIVSGNVEILFTSTSTGMDATMKFAFRRWA